MVGPITRLGLIALVLSAVVSLALAGGDRRAEACGSLRPFDFDTYEPENYVTIYNRAIELATAGKAITFNYNISSGLDGQVDLRYQGLQKGPRTARLPENQALGIPPSIYKSIAWIEANWSNGAASVPYGGVGPVLRSFDCGYGIGQITTGMANNTGAPTARQAVIGTHYLFNMAEGVRILADKWNSAPKYRPVAGNGDPAALEDWYFAIWSYNGFAFVNHPLNPNLNPLRGGGQSPVYHCYDTAAPSYQATSSGGPKFGYGDYTYQERVYGCMRFPPTKDDQRMWLPQTFAMPDFTIEQVAAAFAPDKFSPCEDQGFGGGCTSVMDFPTTIPAKNVVTHPDTTLPVDPALAATLLGDPRVQYTGATNVMVIVGPDGSVSKAPLTVTNVGLGVAPFRVTTSAPWIVVRHDSDATTRTIDGGVAVGLDKEVVTQAAVRGQQRIAQRGMDARLIITIDPSKMTKGVSYGTVTIEPLLGGGGSYQVTVTGVKGYDFRAVIPGLSVGP